MKCAKIMRLHRLQKTQTHYKCERVFLQPIADHKIGAVRRIESLNLGNINLSGFSKEKNVLQQHYSFRSV